MVQTMPKLTISELTHLIKTSLEGSFYGLTLEGEISGFRPASTGHWYFTLKDENASISACIWRSSVPKIAFTPKDGQKVIVTGSISVYDARGTYQIICNSMRLSGTGDILAQLEERKRQYEKLGYFDQSHKKAIPTNPKKLAIITSPTGAALQDILQITGRRNNSMDIIILPAVVQGSEASISVATRIKEVNQYLLADVMIVGRGGGSIEDLLPFSEDCVIQAIYESEIPVISAVGHEIDWALSDFVADLRAPTPSAAAELVCQNQLDQRANFEGLKTSMIDAMALKVREIRLRLSLFSLERVKMQLESKLNTLRLKAYGSTNDMTNEMEKKLISTRSKVRTLSESLKALSPLSILERGYAIVTNKDGSIIRKESEVQIQENLSIRLYDGSIKVKVEEK
ncbi:MAG: exodeoxyribonuclease VII large subunit [Sphaerochaetaceae bacterium]|nr:exodeoxyribonuclease VII large subunit [Sphaerochaetaceae bacterium]